MTSTTGNNKTTPIVLISTGNPASPSAYKGTDSANASPIAPFLLRPAAGPGLGCSRDLPGFFDPGSTPAAHETLRAPVGLHRQLPQERNATHLLRISFQTSSAASRRQRLRRERTPPNWRTLSTVNTTICSSVTPRQSPPRSTTPKLPSPRSNRTPERADLDWLSSESKRALRPPRWKPHLGRTSPSPLASGRTHGTSTQAQHPQRKWRHHQHEPPRQALPYRLDNSTLP